MSSSAELAAVLSEIRATPGRGPGLAAWEHVLSSASKCAGGDDAGLEVGVGVVTIRGAAGSSASGRSIRSEQPVDELDRD